MSAPKTNSPFQQITQFVMIFAIVYIVSQFILNYLYPDRANPQAVQAVSMSMVDGSFALGANPEVHIKNPTSAPVALSATCPQAPFTFEKRVGSAWVEIEQVVEPTCNILTLPTTVEPAGKAVYSLAPWKYSHFNQAGEYQVSLPVNDEILSTTFTVKNPGMFTDIFRTFITKPLLNALVFVASVLPTHSLGWAIVIITLIIKLILYFPTSTALKGQRKLQAIQPKIDALRKKHKNDAQALNKATMELWKQEKVNPFQSCLPLLIQFPVLLGLFFVIRDGSILEYSQHLLYGMFQDIPWSFNTQFLGLDLTKPNIYVLPVLLVALQFTQLRLSFAKSAKAKQSDVIDVTPQSQKKKKDNKSDAVDAAEMQKKVMQYVLPLMIGFFAIQFPAAVAIYWAVSTLFAIGQQVVVNKQV